jgi:hypothetical protein
VRTKASAVVCCLLLIAFCTSVAAQTIDSVGRTSSESALPASGFSWAMSALPWVGSFDLSGVNFLAGARAGYRHLGLNINFGIPVEQLLTPFLDPPILIFFFPQYGSLLDLYPLDLKISGADLLVGAVDLKATLANGLEIFGSIQASIPRQIRAEAGEGPGIDALTPERWSWQGSRFQWAQFDVGAGSALGANLSVIAGLKGERTTVRLEDPEPLPGYTYRTRLVPFGPPVFEESTFSDYGGDFGCYLLMPYLGARLKGLYYNGTFRAGLADSKLKLPLRLSQAGRYIGGLLFGRGRNDLSEEAQYKFSHAGFFVEAAAESQFAVMQNLDLRFWMEGSWLRIQGNGEVELTGQSSPSIFGFAFAPVDFRGFSKGPSHLSQYSLSLGLSGAWSF